MPTFPGRPALWTLAAVAVLDLAWLRAAGVALAVPSLAAPALTVALLLGVALAAERTPGAAAARLAALMQALAFLVAALVAIRVLNHVSMTSALPWADARLAGWDAALGLDWRAWFDAVAARPWLARLLDAAYGRLDGLALAALLLLFLDADLRRARFFLQAFLATAIACTLAGALFPARAAVATHLGLLHDFTAFAGTPGVYHLAALEDLRGPAPGPLAVGRLPGLVTFPSFHTAAGVVMAASFWRTPAFAPVAAYAAVMIAATPVFGGHYLVDLAAGAAVALAVVALLARRPAYRDLFRRRTPARRRAPPSSSFLKYPRG